MVPAYPANHSPNLVCSNTRGAQYSTDSGQQRDTASSLLPLLLSGRGAEAEAMLFIQ